MTQNTAPTFLTGNGAVKTNLGKGTADVANSVAMQSSGKFLVGGSSSNSNGDIVAVLLRYNSDGSLDNNFKIQENSREIESLVVQNDQKILASMGSKIIRYNADGSKDSGFSDDGVVEFPGDAKQLLMQSDNKVLVVGNSDKLGLILARYNSDGSVDNNFNKGYLSEEVESYVYNYSNGIALQQDGKIVVSSYGWNGQNVDFVLRRYTENGILDNTFGNNGKSVTPVGNAEKWSQKGNPIAIQSDGKIVMSGWFNNGNYDFITIRYTSAGTLDTGFGNNGKVVTDFGSMSQDAASSVSIQPDGKIIVAGWGGRSEAAVVRYNLDGSLDNSFGGDGTVTAGIGSETYVNDVLLQHDGKILLVAQTASGNDANWWDFGILRLNSNGNLDLTFSPYNTLADAVVSTESNRSVTIASAVNVFDQELSAKDNYSNANLTLQRQGAANANDIFGVTYPISFDNGILNYSGTAIGTAKQNNGKLDLTFNSNANQAVVTTTLRNLTYTNVGNGESEKITLDWTFSDGNTGSQGEGGVGVATGKSVVNITDLTPPAINNYNPTQYATNVSLNSDIVLTFSESIQRGTGNIVLKNSIGSVIATYDVATSSDISIKGNTLTINSSSDLAFSTRYIVELGKSIVKDASGNAILGTSNYEFTTTAAPKPNSLPTGTVTITGTAIQKQILTASNTLADSDGLGIISYTWLHDDAVIPDATQATYTLTQADVSKKISVKANYTDALGTAENVSSSATSSVINVNDAPTGTVTITGTAIQKQILTASNTLADADGLGTISYTWLRDGNLISNATQATYTLTQADVSKKISVKANYIDALGTAENVTSSSVIPTALVNHSPTGSVNITGTAIKDQVLTVSNTLADVDGLGTIGYTWLKNGTVIPNATQPTYKLTQADTGQNISVKANYIDLQDTPESVVSSSVLVAPNSAPTGTATIKGLSIWGTTLSITSTIKDADGLGALSYTWQNDSGELSTSSKYILQKSDVGKQVWAMISYTDKKGNSETVKSNVIDVTVSTKSSAVNDMLTGTDAADKLSGLAGDDTLIGGLGKDTLTGGVGADVFKFTSISDSSPLSKQADTITDFKHTQGDKIDLSAIDINPTLDGRQSFIPINAQTFSADATGQLRFDAKTSTLYGSTNSDSAPEFAIVLSGVKSLVAEDFIL